MDVARSLSVSLAICAALTGAAAAQTPPDARPSGLVEEVKVSLVQFNVLATDKDGRPVADLKPEELSVRWGGAEQKLAFLQGWAEGTPAPAPVAAAAPAAPQPAPARGRWLVLFFDDFLSTQYTRLRSLAAARTFAREQLRPNDHVSVVAFNGRVNVLLPFSVDRAALAAALDQSEGLTKRATEDRFDELTSLVVMIREQCNPDGDPASGIVTTTTLQRRAACASRFIGMWRNQNERYVDVYTAGLIALIRSLGAVPDAKLLVLFGDGVPRDPALEALDASEIALGAGASRWIATRPPYSYETVYRHLADAAASARVSIFPVMSGERIRSATLGPSLYWKLGGGTRPPTVDIAARTQRNMKDGLEEIAARTGGAVVESLDPGVSVTKISDLSHGLYTAGFYPPHPAEADAQPELKIASRRPGVTLKFGAGLARPVAAAPRGEIRATPAGACAEGQRRAITVRARVERASLSFERVRDTFSANLALLFTVVRPDTGDALFTQYRFFNVAESVEEHQAAGRPDPELEFLITAPCETLVVSCTATDAWTGASGVYSALVAK